MAEFQVWRKQTMQCKQTNQNAHEACDLDP